KKLPRLRLAQMPGKLDRAAEETQPHQKCATQVKHSRNVQQERTQTHRQQAERVADRTTRRSPPVWINHRQHYISRPGILLPVKPRNREEVWELPEKQDRK